MLVSPSIQSTPGRQKFPLFLSNLFCARRRVSAQIFTKGMILKSAVNAMNVSFLTQYSGSTITFWNRLTAAEGPSLWSPPAVHLRRSGPKGSSPAGDQGGKDPGAIEMGSHPADGPARHPSILTQHREQNAGSETRQVLKNGITKSLGCQVLSASPGQVCTAHSPLSSFQPARPPDTHLLASCSGEPGKQPDQHNPTGHPRALLPGGWGGAAP